MFDLKGRVAVITGASSGLGNQIAKAFANHGANLVILARRLETLAVSFSSFLKASSRIL